MSRLSEKQKEYVREASHRWNFKCGATRSGKTYLDLAYTIPKRIRACRGAGLIVLIGNTKATLERNILEPMRSIWAPQLVGTISPQTGIVNLFGKKCYALGADKINQVSKLQGAGIEYCYGDEVTTWHEDVFTMLKSRLDKPNSCFDGTCNPDHPNHYIKKFIDSDVDIFRQDYTIDDNPYLPTEFVDNLKREYSGTVYYDRYILGLWTAAEGVIYRQFADNPDRYIRDSGEIIKAVIGVDFGGNGSAHAFSCVGFTRDYTHLVVLEEYYRKEIITPKQLEQDFIEFVRMCQGKYFIRDCYCDSAEQTLIQGLRQAAAQNRIGINVLNAAKKPINDRIRALNMLMAAGRFWIAPHCRHTIEALRGAVWDSKSLTQDKRLDDGKHNIDSLDALEYAFEHEIRTLIRAVI